MIARLPTATVGQARRSRSSRRGAASLDYVLVICIVLPLAAMTFGIVPRLIDLTYHWTSVLVAWPFM
jgi:hypothetical protein